MAETSKVLTLVFTDLADSTALKSEQGDAVVGEMISRHRSHVTTLAADCSGRIIDWAGDGCFLTFDTSSAAVLFSLRLQQTHSDEADLPGVRIGIHMGEVTEKPGPGEAPRIEGLAVDIAARVSGLAKPGQVLMSSAVHNSARQRMGVDAVGQPILWQAHGTYSLKGFDQPLDISEAGIEGALLEAPKGSEKVRLIKKAAKVSARQSQSQPGIPKWALAAALLLTLLIGIGAGFLISSPSSPKTTSSIDSPIRSLAVLPFDNLMGDDTKEYFVDGMTDTLTAELSKIASIKVIARTSAMKFKDSDEALSEIARQLGVDAFIEGSVQQFEDEIRITAQLIHGVSEEHLWGENFEGTLAGVMKMQGEVAVAIADQIGAVLTVDERESYASAKDVDPDAYDLYLQGMSIMQSRTEADLRAAVELFESALEIDPEIALAYAGIADVYVMMAGYRFATPKEAIEEGLEYAKRAIEIDPLLAEAQMSLGQAYLQYDEDVSLSTSERLILRSLELNPGLTRTRYLYGYILSHQGRIREALEQSRLAVELDPLDPIVLAGVGAVLAEAERFEEAEEVYLRAIDLNPELIFSNMLYQALLWRLGRQEEALIHARALFEATGDTQAEILWARANAVVQGIEAVRMLVAEKKPDVHIEFLWGPHAASLYFALGDVEQALKLLEEGIATPGQSALNVRANVWVHSLEPDLEDRRYLDDDPRFWAMLAKYNLPPLPPEHPRYEKEQAYLRQKAAEAALAAQPKPVRRYAVDLGAEYPLTSISGFRSPVMDASPDGSRLVYVSTQQGYPQLVLREHDTLEARPIPGTEGATQPAFSTDGNEILYFANNEWRVASVTDGTNETITSSSMSTGAAWCDDGTLIIAGGLRQGLERYSREGEPLGEITTMDGGSADAIHAMPHALPDGKGIVYAVSTQPNIEGTRIEALSIETGELIVIANEASLPRYVQTGHIVYVKKGALMAVPFSIDEFRTVGPAVPIREASLTKNSSLPSAYAISNDGTLWYGSVGAGTELYEFVWFDLDGNETPTNLPPRPLYPFVVLSPDGSKLALDDGQDIFTIDLAHGTTNRLTFEPTAERWPEWGPEGENIWYLSYILPGFSLMKRAVNGMGAPEVVLESDEIFWLREWTRDGTRGFGQRFGDGSLDIWMLELGDTPKLVPLIANPSFENDPTLSEDGNWLAYTSDESGQPEIYVRPFPSLDGKWQVTEGGGVSPQWAPDGSKIYYIHGNTVFAVSVDTQSGFTFGRAEELFSGNLFHVGGGLGNLAISPEGDRFLVQKPVEGGAISSQLVVVENWFEELKRLAPHPEAN